MATPLELFFDLVFVVAIAQAASSLHHAVSEAHVAHGLTGYLMVFFAIWWAWINFTWFASAYDCDDVPYRLMVFVQMAGALIIAAGVPAVFEGRSGMIVTIGYVVMRSAVVAQWLRAGAPIRRGERRRIAMPSASPRCKSAGSACSFSPRPSVAAFFALCAVSNCWCRCGPSARPRRRGTRITSRSATVCSR